MRRVLVVGLDGATLTLLEPWVEAGKLPTFASLMKRGSGGRLHSVLHPFTAQAWSSFITGMNPGQHGIFDFWRRDFSGYGFRILNASFREGRSLWGILGQRGKRVVVLNVPMTYPPEEVNGVLVSGMDTPGLNAQYTWPPDLKDEISKEMGEYIITPNDWLYMRRGRPDLAQRELFKEIEVRFSVARYLLQRYPWEFAMVVTTATDGAAHFFWKYFDPWHPLYQEEEAKGYGQTIFEVYRRVDEQLGELLAHLPPETTLLIMSDHGNGPLSERAVYLNAWLREQGLLSLKESRRRALFSSLSARAFDRMKDVLYSLFPYQTLQRLRHLWPQTLGTRLREQSLYADVDWGATKAYAEGIRGSIWINLKERDPQGVVGPGAEYEEMRGLIIAGLSNLRDPRSHEPLIKRAYRREELYHGPYLPYIPDIVVEVSDTAQLFRNGVEGNPVRILGREELARFPTSGGHLMEGVFMAAGEGIKPCVQLSGAQIIDLAPTILYLMGEPIPEEMDGRVLTEIVEESYLEANPIRFEKAPEESSPVDKAAYSETEEAEIKDRLAGLGYWGVK